MGEKHQNWRFFRLRVGPSRGPFSYPNPCYAHLAHRPPIPPDTFTDTAGRKVPGPDQSIYQHKSFKMSQKHTFQITASFQVDAETSDKAFDTLLYMLNTAGLAPKCTHIGLPICLTEPYPVTTPAQLPESEA